MSDSLDTPHNLIKSSSGPLPDTHADSFPASKSHDSPPPRTILAGMVYELDPASVFRVNEVDAADLAALCERLGMSRREIETARRDIARAAQLEATALPITVAVRGHQVEVSVLAPATADVSALLDKVGDVCQLIVDQFRTAGELARTKALRATSPAVLTSRSAGDDTPMKVGRQAARITNLSDAYSAPRSSGDVKVSFVVAGEPDPRPPLVIAAAPPPGSANLKLGKPRPIIAMVHRVSGPGRCEIREEGSEKIVAAEFSTSSDLGLLLRLVAGGHPVQLKVRAYSSDNTEVPPPQAFLIDDLVALTEAWSKEPRFLDDIQAALDKLKTFVEKLRDDGVVARGKGPANRSKWVDGN